MKRRKNMGIYEELQARGLIAQVTDEEEIREPVSYTHLDVYKRQTDIWRRIHFLPNLFRGTRLRLWNW